MSAQAQIASHDMYERLIDAAQRGEVVVAEVFAALRRGEISEEECRDIIRAFEYAKVPTWQRILLGYR